MPKIDISKFSPEDILYLQNQLAKRAKQLSKAKKSQQKPKCIIPDDVDDDWDPFTMTLKAKAQAERNDRKYKEDQKKHKEDNQIDQLLPWLQLMPSFLSQLKVFQE